MHSRSEQTSQICQDMYVEYVGAPDSKSQIRDQNSDIVVWVINLYVQVPFDALMPAEAAFPERDAVAADRERLQMWREAVPDPEQPGE